MSKTGEIPYTWKQIEDQVRDAILSQASILEVFGPWHDHRLVADYLCMDHASHGGRMIEDIPAEELDISKHQLLQHVRLAYDYAYQIDGGQTDIVSVWHDVDGLLQGFPQTDASGEPSPFCTLNDYPLRRMLETFFARFGLFEEEQLPDWDMSLSIRELSLLSNMTVPAVRTSLSKEGFKLEKSQSSTRSNREESSFRLKREDAKLWLSRRRGFIPQRSQDMSARVAQIRSQILADKEASFSDLLSRLLEASHRDIEQVADQAGLDPDWLSSLVSGTSASPDIDSLRSLARTLSLPEPDFAAAAVRHLVAITTN
jgi:hypothetical protein